MKLAGKLLEGKRAVLAAAASDGSGMHSIAELFAAHGCRCVLLDAAPAAAAAKLGPDHRGVSCDVSDAAQCKDAVEQAASALGGLDIAVCCADPARGQDLADISAADLQGLLQAQACGSLFAMQAAIPYLRVAGGGSIVNIASFSAEAGADAAAAAGAVIGLTRAAAREYATDLIRVNAVAPAIAQDAYAAAAGPALFFASDMSAYMTGTVLEAAG